MKPILWLILLLSTLVVRSNNEIDHLLDQAKSNFGQDWEKASDLVSKAAYLSERLEYRLGVIRATQYNGWIEHKSGDIAVGIRHYLEVLELTEETETQDSSSLHFRVYACMNLGVLFKSNQLYDLAIEYLQKGIETANKIGYESQKIALLENLQRTYRDYGRINDAILINHQIISQVPKNSDDYLDALNGLGITHQLTGNLDLAEYYYNELLKGSIDSRDLSNQAYALHNLADVHFTRNQMEKAEEYFIKSISKRLKLKKIESQHVSNSFRDLSKTQFELGKYDDALISSDQAISFVEEVNCSECLVKIYEVRLRILEALELHEDKNISSRALASFSERYDNEKLRVKYESRQPELRLIVSNYYSELESEQRLSSIKNMMIAGLIGGSLLLFLVVGYHLYTRSKTRKLISLELSQLKLDEY